MRWESQCPLSWVGWGGESSEGAVTLGAPSSPPPSLPSPLRQALGGGRGGFCVERAADSHHQERSQGDGILGLVL